MDCLSRRQKTLKAPNNSSRDLFSYRALLAEGTAEADSDVYYASFEMDENIALACRILPTDLPATE